MTQVKRSNSLKRGVSVTHRLKYLSDLVVLNVQRKPVDAKTVIAGIREIAEIYERFSGKSASSASVLEIGFGGRPYRAFAFQTCFKSITAVDLDRPIFGFNDFIPAFQRNGALSATKSLIRAVVFDGSEWRDFHRQMHKESVGYRPERSNFVIADAGSSEFWAANPGPYDLVFSTDVFEHIEPSGLQNLLEKMKAHLTPQGICITRPCVFTGIQGGHSPKWYGHRVETNTSETAWRHLWDPAFEVDTYLNRLTRRDFVKIFTSAGFEILEDQEMCPELGRKHLSAEIQSQLGGSYDDYELFSNVVQFILR